METERAGSGSIRLESEESRGERSPFGTISALSIRNGSTKEKKKAVTEKQAYRDLLYVDPQKRC